MTPLQDDLKHEVGTAVQQEIDALHPASRLGLSRADDEELLRAAQEQGRILVARDRDEGFRQGLDIGVLAERQSVQPVEAFGALRGGWPEDESVDDFLAALHRWRQENPAELRSA